MKTFWAKLLLIVPLILIIAAAVIFSQFIFVPEGNAAVNVYDANVHIYDDATGGDCTSIGTWDWPSRTCTLTTDLLFADNGLEIAGDGITLDGNGHTLTGTSNGNGVYAFGYNNVTIKNVTVTGFRIKGIAISNATGATVINNHVIEDYFGILLYNSSGNTVSGNTVLASGNQAISFNINSNDNLVTNNYVRQEASYGSGISIWASSGNLISGNDVSSKKMFGIGVVGTNNDIRNNTASNSGAGITLGRFGQVTSGNTVAGNVITNNKYGVWFYEGTGNIVTGNTISNTVLEAVRVLYSDGNYVYNNNFLSNAIPVSIEGTSAGNIFNLAAPAGGNYWDIWTSPDTDGDGFVDNPLLFSSGQDGLPYTTADGWCSKPTLNLGWQSVYWANIAEYNAGILTVDYTVDSLFDVYSGRIVGSVNTNGITLVTAMPLDIGDTINAGAGGSLPVTLKYQIPPGVTTFASTVYAAADDACGNSYYYPGPPPVI